MGDDTDIKSKFLLWVRGAFNSFRPPESSLRTSSMDQVVHRVPKRVFSLLSIFFLSHGALLELTHTSLNDFLTLKYLQKHFSVLSQISVV